MQRARRADRVSSGHGGGNADAVASGSHHSTSRRCRRYSVNGAMCGGHDRHARRRRPRSPDGTMGIATGACEMRAESIVFLRSSTPPIARSTGASGGRLRRARSTVSVRPARARSARVHAIADEVGVATDSWAIHCRHRRLTTNRQSAAVRARSCSGEARIVERIDVVHGARKATDQAAPLSVARHSRDAVLGMPDVEAPMLRPLEMPEVVANAGLDHRRDVASDGGGHNAHRPTNRVAEEACAARVRRMHRHVVAEPGERIAELERMHDPATRVGRMGEDGDAQRQRHASTSTCRQPISGATAKSQMVSTAVPSAMTTRRSAVIVPMSAAAIPRAQKCASTAGRFVGATASR